MECPKCGTPLYIAGSKFTSDVGSTDVYSELTMVCPNRRCEMYCGTDLNNPQFVVQTVKNKI